MPTLGWIQEDAVEAFLTANDRTPDPVRGASKQSHVCPFCQSTFEKAQALQAHIGQQHAVTRPVMLLRGSEPRSSIVVRRPITASDLEFIGVTRAEIVRDGTRMSPNDTATIADAFPETGQAEISLSLWNDQVTRAQPVKTSYGISFRIAEADELTAVESAFSDHLLNNNLTRSAIGRFLSDQRVQGGARDYATGLAHYVMGILLKERPDTETLTTSYSRYREEYGAALEILSEFDRPLARFVSDVVRFTMNDFSNASSRSGFWELDLANKLLISPDTHIGAIETGRSKRRPYCPIDHGTGRVLDELARLIRQERWSPILDDECKRASESEVLDAGDRNKILAVWAIAAWRTGARENAVVPLRQLVATYPFSQWATDYLEAWEK